MRRPIYELYINGILKDRFFCMNELEFFVEQYIMEYDNIYKLEVKKV